MSHKTEKTIYYYHLQFKTEPKLRWVDSSDPRLSKSLMDEFLVLKNNKKYKNQCNSNSSKLTLINNLRTYGIVVIFHNFIKNKFLF